MPINDNQKRYTFEPLDYSTPMSGYVGNIDVKTPLETLGKVRDKVDESTVNTSMLAGTINNLNWDADKKKEITDKYNSKISAIENETDPYNARRGILKVAGEIANDIKSGEGYQLQKSLQEREETLKSIENNKDISKETKVFQTRLNDDAHKLSGGTNIKDPLNPNRYNDAITGVQLHNKEVAPSKFYEAAKVLPNGSVSITGLSPSTQDAYLQYTKTKIVGTESKADDIKFLAGQEFENNADLKGTFSNKVIIKGIDELQKTYPTLNSAKALNILKTVPQEYSLKSKDKNGKTITIKKTMTPYEYEMMKAKTDFINSSLYANRTQIKDVDVHYLQNVDYVPASSRANPEEPEIATTNEISNGIITDEQDEEIKTYSNSKGIISDIKEGLKSLQPTHNIEYNININSKTYYEKPVEDKTKVVPHYEKLNNAKNPDGSSMFNGNVEEMKKWLKEAKENNLISHRTYNFNQTYSNDKVKAFAKTKNKSVEKDKGVIINQKNSIDDYNEIINKYKAKANGTNGILNIEESENISGFKLLTGNKDLDGTATITRSFKGKNTKGLEQTLTEHVKFSNDIQNAIKPFQKFSNSYHSNKMSTDYFKPIIDNNGITKGFNNITEKDFENLSEFEKQGIISIEARPSKNANGTGTVKRVIVKYNSDEEDSELDFLDIEDEIYKNTPVEMLVNGKKQYVKLNRAINNELGIDNK